MVSSSGMTTRKKWYSTLRDVADIQKMKKKGVRYTTSSPPLRVGSLAGFDRLARCFSRFWGDVGVREFSHLFGQHFPGERKLVAKQKPPYSR